MHVRVFVLHGIVMGFFMLFLIIIRYFRFVNSAFLRFYHACSCCSSLLDVQGKQGWRLARGGEAGVVEAVS